MPPLRHAMGLVDGDQRQWRLSEQVQRTRQHQPLRRHVQQIQLAGPEPGFDLGSLLVIQRGIEICRPDPQLAQGGDLIGHQCDQRRHDNPDPLTDQRRDLITDGFTAAGRHQHQHVLPGDGCIDNRRLLSPKRRIPVDPLQDFLC